METKPSDILLSDTNHVVFVTTFGVFRPSSLSGTGGPDGNTRHSPLSVPLPTRGAGGGGRFGPGLDSGHGTWLAANPAAAAGDQVWRNRT